jgi:hypothetical protein
VLEAYVPADMTIKEKALALTAPVTARAATGPPTRSSSPRQPVTLLTADVVAGNAKLKA